MLAPNPDQLYVFAVPSHQGALANVINAGRDAVDAGGTWTNVPEADGEVVWFWRPDAGVKPRGLCPCGRRWQTSPVSGKSTKETVKTIACGNAGLFRWTCGDYARVLCFFRTRGCGCIGRPAFPTPLRGRRNRQTSGEGRCENANASERLAVRKAKRSKQSRTRHSRGATDCFASLAMTSRGPIAVIKSGHGPLTGALPEYGLLAMTPAPTAPWLTARHRKGEKARGVADGSLKFEAYSCRRKFKRLGIRDEHVCRIRRRLSLARQRHAGASRPAKSSAFG